MIKRPLKILLAGPRGFCAGVDRAIQIVDLAIEKHGPPVYVRHEIVHNRYVVEELEAKGAVFVEELDEVPEGVPVVFSAHGVPKSVFSEAQGSQNETKMELEAPQIRNMMAQGVKTRAKIGPKSTTFILKNFLKILKRN